MSTTTLDLLVARTVSVAAGPEVTNWLTVERISFMASQTIYRFRRSPKLTSLLESHERCSRRHIWRLLLDRTRNHCFPVKIWRMPKSHGSAIVSTSRLRTRCRVLDFQTRHSRLRLTMYNSVVYSISYIICVHPTVTSGVSSIQSIKIPMLTFNSSGVVIIPQTFSTCHIKS